MAATSPCPPVSLYTLTSISFPSWQKTSAQARDPTLTPAASPNPVRRRLCFSGAARSTVLARVCFDGPRERGNGGRGSRQATYLAFRPRPRHNATNWCSDGGGRVGGAGQGQAKSRRRSLARRASDADHHTENHSTATKPHVYAGHVQ